MPKSRNGKKHKKKLIEYKKRLKQKQDAIKKSYMEMMDAKYKEKLNDQPVEDKSVDIEGIDTDDMIID